MQVYPAQVSRNAPCRGSSAGRVACSCGRGLCRGGLPGWAPDMTGVSSFGGLMISCSDALAWCDGPPAGAIHPEAILAALLQRHTTLARERMVPTCLYTSPFIVHAVHEGAHEASRVPRAMWRQRGSSKC